MICGCGREIKQPEPSESIVAAGGWCRPSELAYADDYTTIACSDCNSRMMMMLMIGIDPGRDGENLRVRRGGITYGTPG